MTAQMAEGVKNAKPPGDQPTSDDGASAASDAGSVYDARARNVVLSNSASTGGFDGSRNQTFEGPAHTDPEAAYCPAGKPVAPSMA